MVSLSRIGLAGLMCVAGAVRAGESFDAQAAACPDGLAPDTRCYAGRDTRGAYYWIAIPGTWNGSLVVHTHGGPKRTAPSKNDPIADLKRFSVVVHEGFAWAGSSYHHEGFGVRDAALDTDTLRRIFWEKFGRPKHTLLHGQSWGAGVAAKTAELYGSDGSGRPVYDGVVLTSGVLGGGTQSYDFRADLRAVYQYYCHNLPRPDEPAYPLWQGLGAEDRLTLEELNSRITACTGAGLPPANRSVEQQRNLRNILNVVRIPERTLVHHLAWATFDFRYLVLKQLHGSNPFSNMGVVYAGSDDDVALNNGVQRFAATRAGIDALAYDADLSGRLTVPTLTLHAIDDPTAFIELESAFDAIVAKAGAGNLLVQSFTDEHEHEKEATPEYAALLRVMITWIEDGRKPTGETLVKACQDAITRYGEACHFDLTFHPQPLATRVYRRDLPL